jgi:hypothetical protein
LIRVVRGPYAAVHMHRFLLASKHVRTLNPAEADFFYVPGRGLHSSTFQLKLSRF